MCGIMLQADYALSRLVALKERTEATESLAKMHLAQRRNELVSFDLMMSVISINIGFFGAVAALCGMNLWLAGSKAPKVCRAYFAIAFLYTYQKSSHSVTAYCVSMAVSDLCQIPQQP